MLISDKRSSIASLIAMGFERRNIFYIFIALGISFGMIGLVIGISLSMVISENLSMIVTSIEEMASVRLYQPEIYYLAENRWKGDTYTGEHKDGKGHGQGTYTW